MSSAGPHGGSSDDGTNPLDEAEPMTGTEIDVPVAGDNIEDALEDWEAEEDDEDEEFEEDDEEGEDDDDEWVRASAGM